MIHRDAAAARARVRRSRRDRVCDRDVHGTGVIDAEYGTRGPWIWTTDVMDVEYVEYVDVDATDVHRGRHARNMDVDHGCSRYRVRACATTDAPGAIEYS